MNNTHSKLLLALGTIALTLALQAQLLAATFHAGVAIDASVEQTSALLEALEAYSRSQVR